MDSTKGSFRTTFISSKNTAVGGFEEASDTKEMRWTLIIYLWNTTTTVTMRSDDVSFCGDGTSLLNPVLRHLTLVVCRVSQMNCHIGQTCQCRHYVIARNCEQENWSSEV